MTETAVAPKLADILSSARIAARELAATCAEAKNAALRAVSDALLAHSAAIVAANDLDLARARDTGVSAGLQDRLRLDAGRVRGLSAAVLELVALVDPVGQVVRGSTLPNGLRLSQVRVPFGVVGAIYEARPNVTVDIAALALKSGNAVVLRGGSAAEDTNRVLVEVLQGALASVGLPFHAVQTIDAFGRDGARELMRARGAVDVLIPRGSADLIDTVVRESTVPVIETGAGVVHMYLDESVDVRMAVELVHNAKVQRPSVCNALETLLVHVGAVDRVLPPVVAALRASGVTVHADGRAASALSGTATGTDAGTGTGTGTGTGGIVAAIEEDWATEYLSLDLAVRVVDDIDAAMDHIRQYSTHHTESILTNDLVNAERFLAEVDSAVVMVNASTRFTDGGEFGFGAEVGISTQKLHARGPMGLPELTSTKWIVRGSGHARG